MNKQLNYKLIIESWNPWPVRAYVHGMTKEIPMSYARKIKTDVGQVADVAERADSGSLSFKGKLPFKNCRVGETKTIELKVKVTGLSEDEYGSNFRFEISKVGDYK